MAGPNEGHTRVKLFGTGFNGGQNREDVHVKWGVVSTAKVEKDQVLGSEVLMAYKKETYNVQKVDH